VLPSWRSPSVGGIVAVSRVALTVCLCKRVLFVTVSRRPFLALFPKCFPQSLWGMSEYTETHVTMLILSVRRTIGLRLLLK
jgi:hypothetical protein